MSLQHWQREIAQETNRSTITSLPGGNARQRLGRSRARAARGSKGLSVVKLRAPLRAVPLRDRGGRPFRVAILVASVAGVRRFRLGGKVRSGNAERVVEARIDDHVAALRRVALDARDRLRVVMMRGRVVRLPLEPGGVERSIP